MHSIHYLQIEETIPSLELFGFKVRDIGLLDSAISRPAASAFGEDAYPTLPRKLAAMFSSIVRNQPLFDGNKRSSWLLTKSFLNLNGYTLNVSAREAFDFIVTQAAKQEDLDEIEAFFVKHMVEF